MQCPIDLYVVSMLRQRGECPLPGMGTLHLEMKAAQVESNQIVAPKVHIRWTSNADLKNTTLIDWIAQEGNVSNENASFLLEQWLLAIKEAAQTPAGYNLEGLGVFRFQQTSWLWENYLNQYPTPPARWENNKTIDTQSSETKQNDTEASNTPAEPGIVSDTEPHNNNQKTLWIIAISLLLLIGAGFLYWNNQPNTSNEEVESSIPNTPAIDNPTSIVDSPTSLETDSLEISNRNNADTTSIPSNTHQTGTYDVVVYQYNNLARAEKQSAKYSRNGNISKVVTTADSQFLVVIQAQTTQTDTARIVDSIRSFFNPKGRLYILK